MQGKKLVAPPAKKSETIAAAGFADSRDWPMAWSVALITACISESKIAQQRQIEPDVGHAEVEADQRGPVRLDPEAGARGPLHVLGPRAGVRFPEQAGVPQQDGPDVDRPRVGTYRKNTMAHIGAHDAHVRRQAGADPMQPHEAAADHAV